MATLPVSLPNEIDIRGARCLPDTKGGYTRVDAIRPADQLLHELAYRLTDYAADLSAEIARFQSHAYADVAAFDAMLAQDYGVERDEESKGNRTYTSFDGLRQVKVQVQDRVTFGPELSIAKRLLDEMIRERSDGADSFLVSLVNRAFKTDKEGKVDYSDLLALRRMEVDDPRWPNVCKAIDDSQRPLGSKRYIRFYARKTPDGRFEQIALDMAAVEPTAAAFARPSLRRTKEEAGRHVGLAVTCLADGAPSTAIRHLLAAAAALGVDPAQSDLAVIEAMYGPAAGLAAAAE